MTRKLTDEQVKAIKELNQKGASAFVKIQIKEGLNIIVQVVGFDTEPYQNWQVFLSLDNENEQFFVKVDEAIAYAEHLLNQRYVWLPQQTSWIMSGEVINLTNAGKLIELMNLAGRSSLANLWYNLIGEGSPPNRFFGTPSFESYIEGITIYPDSPIWDAVKGVE
jgi:hypothetical protein